MKMARLIVVISAMSLMFKISDVTGQFKNIKLDERSSEDKYVCEPTIAINPRDPNNIVAAAVLNNVYTTFDGGQTWKKVKVSSPFGVYGDPALTVDSKGNFYFFHLSDPTNGSGDYSSEKLDRIVVQSSGDGGLNWSEGASIGFNHPKDQDKEWPAVDGKGNLYVTWTQFDKYGSADANCLSTILFSKSRNGNKWSDPMELSQTPGNCMDDDGTAEGAMPAVSTDGKIYVAWSNQNQIYFDRSFDGGAMWLRNDLVVAQQPGGWNLEVPGHDRCNGMPVVAVNNSKTMFAGHVYLLWADQKNGPDDTDIWFIRSANSGDNWTQPLKVNNDGKGKHQYLAWMTVDQTTGYIYVIFYDRREATDSSTEVYLAFSTDNGTTFKNVKISENAFTPTEGSFFGDYTNIAAHKGIVTPIWTRMDDGKTSVWMSIIRHEDLEKAVKK